MTDVATPSEDRWHQTRPDEAMAGVFGVPSPADVTTSAGGTAPALSSATSSAAVPSAATVSAIPSPRRETVARPLSAASLRVRGVSRLPGSLLRFGVKPFLFAGDAAALGFAVWVTSAQAADLLLLGITVVAFNAAGLYGSRLTMSVLEDSSHIVARVLAAAGLIVAMGTVRRSLVDSDTLFLTALGFVVGVLVLRAFGYCVVREVRRRGWIAHPTLLLGGGFVGGQLATLLLEHPEYGMAPVGFLDRDPLLASGVRPIPLLGSDEVLAETIVEFGVRNIIVAFGSEPESSLVEVIRTCDRLECEIFFIPRLFELHTTTRDVDQVRGLPLVRLRRAAYRTHPWQAKRTLDLLLAGFALFLLLPLLAVLAIAVRLEGGPGILFRQIRVGLDNEPFEILKFRSMRPVDETESATNWNIAQDRRVGPVGRFMRSSSLDELPQLWNILRGDMSIVGPRPERPHFVSTFSTAYPRYLARHRVKAGLTGWAQVHGLRGDTSIEERARFDNYYIENWTIWLDLRIIVRTIAPIILRMGG